MEVSDLTPFRPVPRLGLEIISKEYVKDLGDKRVCSCIAQDASGECTLTLWNRDIDRFQEGDFVLIQRGWCKEYNGRIQVSAGKFGNIKLVTRPEKKKKDTSNARKLGTDPRNLDWYLRPTLYALRTR